MVRPRSPQRDLVARVSQQAPNRIDLLRRSRRLADLADELTADLVPVAVVADEVPFDRHVSGHEHERDLGNAQALVGDREHLALDHVATNRLEDDPVENIRTDRRDVGWLITAASPTVEPEVALQRGQAATASAAPRLEPEPQAGTLARHVKVEHPRAALGIGSFGDRDAGAGGEVVVQDVALSV